MLKSAQQAPALVRLAEHRKLVRHRSQQAQLGEDAVTSWSEKYCKVIYLSKIELLPAALSTFRTQVAARLRLPDVVFLIDYTS